MPPLCGALEGRDLPSREIEGAVFPEDSQRARTVLLPGAPKLI
jgi:hypothetical protein